jgi:ATP-dependent Lon protease
VREDQVGVATGLAWTEAGGDVLVVEASTMEGRGNLILTGKLGEVMRESAQAALSYARARSAELGIPRGYFDSRDVHVHVPEGAIPKDGPSAGITMAAAMLSAFTHRPVRSNVAMTGEITLRGNVLAVGGIKEKILAARRSGVRTVVVPESNRRSVEEVPRSCRREMDFIFVRDVREVFGAVLVPEASIGASRRRRAPVPGAVLQSGT